ncbi:MAG TPA: Maf family protein [Pyrinomonadaceae bacterium]
MITEKLILASKSPRRAELLSAVGWSFETVPADIDETRRDNEIPSVYVKRLAIEKAEAVAARLSTGLILAADTTVVVDEYVLGQPVDDEDARRMLKLLNGRWHEVLTGVALMRAGESNGAVSDYETTRVKFSQMSDDEIDWYVSTGEPRGKAGAYGIQGRASILIEEIQGDYFNIVGLPLRLVYEMARGSLVTTQA